MNSWIAGKSISEIEVTNISIHGLWLYVRGEEYFLPYVEYPWFKNAKVAELLNVEEPSTGHFYWPDLDIDLSEKIINGPDNYPLKANHITKR